jgi:hypothetical protein
MNRIWSVSKEVKPYELIESGSRRIPARMEESAFIEAASLSRGREISIKGTNPSKTS